MATVRKRLYVRELPSKIATTFPERSKWRCAKPMSTGTARSSPTSSPSQSRSRIATSSPRRSRVRDEDSSQVSQEVQLHQGLQGAAQGDLRPVREEVHSAVVRHGREAHMQVRPQGAVPG